MKPLNVLAAAALVAAALMPATAIGQTRPKVQDLGIERPASAIFIGNSFFYYNNSLHTQVLRLLWAANPDHRMRITSVTISGSNAEWHDVESYFRPNALGSFSFDADNNIVFNKVDRVFDLAVMMDCSLCPIHPQLKSVFHDSARKHSAAVRKHGAKPVWFMSWAYADKPDMIAELAEAYTKAGNDNDAFVIPAGLAFARALKERPDLVLHASDKRHPSLAGTYLAAATVYAALFKQSPVGSSYTAGIEAPTAKLLQSAAWDTVQDYFRAQQAGTR